MAAGAVSITFAIPQEAEAFGLGAMLGGVASTLVQGLGYSKSPVPTLLNTAFSTLGGLMGSSPPSPPSVNNAATTVSNNYINSGNTHMVGAFGNYNHVAQQPTLFYTRSASPISIADSDEQFLRSDPYGYMRKEGDFLLDHVKNYTSSVYPFSPSVPARTINLSAPPPFSGFGGGGFYPASLFMRDSSGSDFTNPIVSVLPWQIKV
ncbi:hypothetical protein ACN9MF_20115 [Methylobacterium fujisawaense]|uniref:hypothetical protein n=1 Tax=Methylobacterium fujisawaense TaxID=107400 RepID=UPI003CF68A85